MIKYFDKMKKILSILVVLLLAVSAFAQNPKLSYQAVVRDSENKLVVEQPVTMTVNVLKADNTPQFEQMLNATTNRNGLMSLEIGNDTPAWNNIDWTGAKIRTAITLSSGAEVVDTTVVNAVPFALYANSVNTNAIPQSDWAETSNNSCTYIRNKPSISDTVNRILTDGNYVTTTMIDARGYLTADSAVITTMQGNIATNANNITTNTNAIAAAVNKEQADSTTLASRIDALEGAAATNCNGVKACIADTLNKYTTTDQLCNVVNTCDLSGNASIANLSTLLQGLSDQMEAMNEKMDSLEHIVDSLTTFHCGKQKVRDIEGNEYATVKIGNQCWMAENMRATKCPKQGNINMQAGSLNDAKAPYLYVPNENVTTSLKTYTPEEYVKKFGYLYNFYAAADTVGELNGFPTSRRRGICPEGWHIPNHKEWFEMRDSAKVESYKYAGKLAGGNDWSSYTSTITNPGNYDYAERNIVGFDALPAGTLTAQGISYTIGKQIGFWTINLGGVMSSDFCIWELNINSEGFNYWSGYPAKNGYSVRCLKD